MAERPYRELEPWAWTRGAVWLLPDGRPVLVPGFHDDWIRQHQERVPGCANVCDVVLKMRWLSVVAYGEGYVELMIPSKSDDRAVGLCAEYLRRNLERWKTALVMTMDEEGYLRLSADEFGGPGRAEAAIASAPAMGATGEP